MSTDTETIDRLFLELSQFTTARTRREIELRELNAELLAALIDLAELTEEEHRGWPEHEKAKAAITKAETVRS